MSMFIYYYNMSEYLEILRLEWGPVQYELGLMNYEKSFLNWYIKMINL
jgi:hypothetical protein